MLEFSNVSHVRNLVFDTANYKCIYDMFTHVLLNHKLYSKSECYLKDRNIYYKPYRNKFYIN